MTKQIKSAAKQAIAGDAVKVARVVTIPANVQAGYDASNSAAKVAAVYAKAIEACEGASDVKRVNDEYRVGLMAHLYVKREGKQARDACPIGAYKLALDMLAGGKAEREKAGWQTIYKHANVRLFQLQQNAGLKDSKPRGTKARAEDAKASDRHTGASGAPATPDRKAAAGRDVQKELGAFLKSHKPSDYAQVANMAFSTGKAFGFWTKGDAGLFDGTETPKQAAAVRDAMLAFHAAMAAAQAIKE